MSRPSPTTAVKPQWTFPERQEGRTATFSILRDFRLKAEKTILTKVGQNGEATQQLAYFELDADPRTYYSESAMLTAWEANAAREHS
jgi:hypothetical protein